MVRKKIRENRIYCTECKKGMSKIEEGEVDLIVTSPPYDNLRKYKGDREFDFEGIAKEMYRVLKEGGVLVWVVGDQTIDGGETGTSFKQALKFKEIGFKLYDTMIYQKSGCATPEKRRYYRQFEYMFVFSKGRPETVNLIRDRKNSTYGTRVNNRTREYDGEFRENSAVRNNIEKYTPEYGVRFNVWQYKPENLSKGTDKIKFKHPAVFPDALARDHIITWSNEGDLVMDPFAGSGTTLVKAKELNRRYIGFEIVKEYVDIARERLKKVKKKKEEY